MDGTTPEDQPVGPHPAIMIAKILAAMAEPFVISEAAYNQRIKLMGLHAELSEYGIPFESVKSAGEIYMYCTYTDAPNKHAIKRTVNKWFRDMALASMDIPECTRKPEPKARPKILIPLEWFGTNHSMFRCYAAALESLKDRFETVGMYGGEASDNDAAQVFERVLHMPQAELEFTQITEMIHAEAPDIILFPSVGMSTWCITLANVRLAPLQIACPGHPASTFSEHIDYLCMESALVGDETRYSENLLRLPSSATRFIRRTDGVIPVRGALDTRRIAIPAIAQKLIPLFMQALKRIEAECPDVEWHFFPNQTDLQHAMVDYEIRKWFPRAKVYVRSDYQTYLDRLASCGLALDTFPFGGTNSLIDAMLCGVPVISLDGLEISEKVGAFLLRRMNLPRELLIADSVDDYVNKAMTLIKHPHWEPEMPSVAQIEAEFFQPSDGALSDAIFNLWEASCKEIN